MTITADEHVVRFQVSVDDLVRVDVLKGADDLSSVKSNFIF